MVWETPGAALGRMLTVVSGYDIDIRDEGNDVLRAIHAILDLDVFCA
jgi:hypothetical protein